MKKNQISSLNPLKFLSIVMERNRRFKNASNNELPEEYPVNLLAKKMHPEIQFVKVADVVEHGQDCKTFTFIPNKEKGTTELAYFSAGKYLSVFLQVGEIKFTRAYSLCSAPKESLSCVSGDKDSVYQNGFYQITVKGVKGGLASRYILDNWKIGTEVEVSAPEGNFEYISLRDAPHVICIAGGSGITPFLSMAKAICDGDENFEMTLLYGSRSVDQILFREEFNDLLERSKKLRVVHVLSDDSEENRKIVEQGSGRQNLSFESGFITGDLIKKYAPENEKYSVFMCGPQAMYDFADKELAKLGLEKKYIRKEVFGEIHSAKLEADYPGFEGGSENNLSEPLVNITVYADGEKFTVKGNPDNTILQILEQNKIAIPTKCRSGECGFCHSYLRSGKVYVPAKLDARRKADIIYGYIHPCCTFALSDLEIEVTKI